MFNKADELALPFNEEFQMAIVAHCLRDYRFFYKCNEILKPNWFTKNAMLANIFQIMKQSFKENGVSVQSTQDLMNEKFFLLQSEKDQVPYVNLLEKCSVLVTNGSFNLEKMKKQLTGWSQFNKLQEMAEGTARTYKSLGLEEAYSWAKERIREVEQCSFEDDSMAMSFDNPLEWLNEELKSKNTSISTGNSRLDFALGGGLFKGETTAIMAPVNTGKSTFMNTIVRHALKQNKKVMWITHEDSPNKLRRKLFASMLGVPREFVLNPNTLMSEEFRADAMALSMFLKQNLVYLPYSKIGKMYIEDVAAEIEKRHKKLKEDTGSGFDIIVDDYPKKLKVKHKSELYRAELAEVYDVFNQIAIELNVHCLVAMQTNREGLKQNNGKVKSDFLTGMDMVDESFGIAQNMGNIITLNRSPDDRRTNLVRFNIAKSRNDITDVSITTRSSYSCGLIHGDLNMFNPSIEFVVINPSTKMPKKISYDLKTKPNLKYKYLASIGRNDNVIIPSDELNLALQNIEEGRVNDKADFENFKESFAHSSGDLLVPNIK